MAETDLILAAQTAGATIPNRPEGSVGPLLVDSNGRLRTNGGFASDAVPNYASDMDAPFSLDRSGHLRVTDKFKSFPPVVGTINTVGSVLPVDVSEAANVFIHFRNIGTTSILTTAWKVYAEGSVDSTDGTDGTWFEIQASRTIDNQTESNPITLASLANVSAGNGQKYGWTFSVAAFRWFRLRTVNVGPSTGSPQWTITRSSHAIPATVATGIQYSQLLGVSKVTQVSDTPFSFETLATTNLRSIRGIQSVLNSISVSNLSANTMYVKIYSKASAPVVASDTPEMTIPVPANSFATYSFGPTGYRLSLGFGLAITGAAAKTDATAVAAGSQVALSYGDYITNI